MSVTRSDGRSPVCAATGQAIATDGEATGEAGAEAVSTGLAVGATVTIGATDGVADGAALGVVDPQATATRATTVARMATAAVLLVGRC
jgi:hypothetical protein